MIRLPYLDSPLIFARRPTRRVALGAIGVGGDEPLRVQSMTTTPTWDVEATLAQMQRLQEAGCEIVRVTVPSKRDLDALEPLRAGMSARGLTMPLVADIHFAPKLAFDCIPFVDKVRINPGNFVDSKRFLTRDYTDAEYQDELDRIEAAFTPLVLELKRHGRALRVGTNHGSLADRILNRYGDTPHGMVESALEYLRLCARLDYHEVVLSMKASNPIVMIQAYRLLVARMASEGMRYPLHLGVTEAGDGLDGRVKSAVGIGSLLLDGLGDTIRVSLTEDPVAEIPVGFKLARLVGSLGGEGQPEATPSPGGLDPYRFARRSSRSDEVSGLAYGDGAPPRVELDVGRRWLDEDELRLSPSPHGDGVELISGAVNCDDDLTRASELSSQARAIGARLELRLNPTLVRSGPSSAALELSDRIELAGLGAGALDEGRLDRWLEACEAHSVSVSLRIAESADLRALDALAPDSAARFSLSLALSGLYQNGLALGRELSGSSSCLTRPVVLSFEAPGLEPALAPASLFGALLCDGIGDALRLPARLPYDAFDPTELAYTILQAARYRTVKTEYVSCPSCGRTLFDLEETTAKIKALTSHLPNVTIAIMGCIVNGPGEMADADFGYVGWKPGLVDLYVGQHCVEKAVPEAGAPERLVALLKARGAWIEPTPATSAP